MRLNVEMVDNLLTKLKMGPYWWIDYNPKSNALSSSINLANLPIREDEEAQEREANGSNFQKYVLDHVDSHFLL